MENNLRNVTVGEHEFTVNDSYAQSWGAFELVRKFNRDDLSAFDKLDLSFELIEKATGVTQDEIIEYAGGVDAPATDVIQFAAEIVQAIAPKN